MSKKSSYNDKLRALYNDLKSPSSFSAKLHDFLRQHKTHSLNRRIVKRVFPRRKIVARFPYQFWMADTINYLKFKTVNNHYAYIMVIIDCFTRKLWALPMKHVNGKDTLEVFETVFDSIDNNYPRHLVTDAGTEFFNKLMEKFFKSHNVNHFTTPTRSPSKASMAERVIRTLKTRISRYMQLTKKNRWIDALSQLVVNYNETPHSSLPNRLTPNAVNYSKSNQNVITRTAFLKLKKARLHRHRPRLHIGDRVRVLLKKKTFDKGYARSWSDQIYVIEKVFGAGTVFYYRISRYDADDDDNDDNPKRLMPGIYYYYQLNLVVKASSLVI